MKSKNSVGPGVVSMVGWAFSTFVRLSPAGPGTRPQVPAGVANAPRPYRLCDSIPTDSH